MDSSRSFNDIPLRVRPTKLSTDTADGISALDQETFSFDIEQPPREPNNTSEPLERRLGLWSGMGIVMGSIIGSGIFSTPALILGSVGSVGMSIVVWVIGALVSICSCAAYMELGTMLPRSGGEKAYLEAAFPRPRALLGFIFCLTFILICYPTGLAADAVVTGSYLLYAVTGQATGHSVWAERAIGVGVAGLCALMHACVAKAAIRTQSFLTVVKALLLLLVVFVGLFNVGKGQLAHNVFAGTSTNANDYASALFKVFFAYSGFTALNYAVDELKQPEKTLPRAALGGLSVTAVLYVLSNVAYFAVLDVQAISSAGTTVAGVFFTEVLGETWGQRIVPVFIALATLGNVMCGVFSASRVVFAAARDGYLPLDHLWASVNQTFGTPVWALGATWALITVFIVLPPPGEAYALLIDVGGYPFWVFSGLAVIGLVRMRFTHGDLVRPFRAWMPAIVVSICAAVFMCVVPFIRPSDAGSLAVPYWVAPVTGVVFIAVSCGLWFVKTVLLNHVEYHKQINEDQI
ncbi:methionine permease [Coemansia erecta]|uniref:Methionine permease n=1 Tax=Coemansia asiatica TaxID=1052880 RepID=A0A9W7XNJ2_9FUNG|nr:methionine permease [Coemansia asiatica]KAJ2857674.1 methionine permease [Coemansia erecta]KAJ2888285.1 methionine permease [Coemansia asiatica]